MELNKDFEEFFELLNKHKVTYIIVGGYAVTFHGYPRFTGDIDLFYQLDQKNLEALKRTLADFGIPFSEENVKELFEAGRVAHIGNPPNRINLLNKITAVDFAKAWKDKVSGRYGTQSVFYIGLEDLLKNKSEAARNKDKEDVDFFQKSGKTS